MITPRTAITAAIATISIILFGIFLYRRYNSNSAAMATTHLNMEYLRTMYYRDLHNIHRANINQTLPLNNLPSGVTPTERSLDLLTPSRIGSAAAGTGLFLLLFKKVPKASLLGAVVKKLFKK